MLARLKVARKAQKGPGDLFDFQHIKNTRKNCKRL